MMRLGLCCIFKKEPIKFRTTTAAFVLREIARGHNYLERISEIVLSNCNSLARSIVFCSENNIGAFRIFSGICPLYTHPDLGYQLDDLKDHSEIVKTLSYVKEIAKEKNVRLSFHPDQFVVLNSPNKKVVAHSIEELEYQTMVAKMVGADVINIHGGGGYGDKEKALLRFEENFSLLSKEAQKRLTIENDDKVFNPSDLLPICQKLKIPLVYDVHHHRCLQDDLSVEEATEKALSTWDREPMFHMSSPKSGWESKNLKLHAEYINIKDMPLCWKKIQSLTIDIEAKDKELAIKKLLQQLKKSGWQV